MTTARRKFMPVKEIARYMVQLLRGLAHLHKHKVVHCDVSPQNVFLRRDREVSLSLPCIELWCPRMAEQLDHIVFVSVISSLTWPYGFTTA